MCHFIVSNKFFLFVFFFCSKQRNPRRRTNSNNSMALQQQKAKTLAKPFATAPADPDPEDDPIAADAGSKRPWAWRVAKYALPMQIAIVVLLCAACFLEPHCCDGVNNMSWSLTPQLRYVRGPPPTWIPYILFCSNRRSTVGYHASCTMPFENKKKQINKMHLWNNNSMNVMC